MSISVACPESPPIEGWWIRIREFGRASRFFGSPAASSSLTVTTINRILKRRGWVGKKDSNAPALQRFERSTPNELWQMDGKGKYRSSDGTCYPLSILDDHSRYAVGLYGLRAFTAEQVYPCLVRTFERYGVPEAMLMDHGTIWWGTSNGYGLT